MITFEPAAGDGSASRGRTETNLAVTALPADVPVSVGAAQRSTSPYQARRRPGPRDSSAPAMVAGRTPRRGTDLPEGLLDELAGLTLDEPSRAWLRDRVIEWCLPMAVCLARSFGGRGELLDDLTQVATIGLIKAVDRFDPARGTEFASSAVPTIVGEIRRHFRDTTWGVRVPRRVRELKLRMPGATEELFHVLRRVPTSAELAERLGISRGDMASAQLAANAYRPFSIDQSPGRPSPRPEDRFGGPDPEFEAVDNRSTLRVLLAELPVREQRILVMRFEADMSQAQIAAAIGVSQMQVSRLLAKSLARLREGFIREGPPSGGQATRGGRRRSPATSPPSAVARSSSTKAMAA